MKFGFGLRLLAEALIVAGSIFVGLMLFGMLLGGACRGIP